jgi:hypothetical protein
MSDNKKLIEMLRQKRAYLVMKACHSPAIVIDDNRFVCGQRYEAVWWDEYRVGIFYEGHFVEMPCDVCNEFFDLIRDFPLPSV